VHEEPCLPQRGRGAGQKGATGCSHLNGGSAPPKFRNRTDKAILAAGAGRRPWHRRI